MTAAGSETAVFLREPPSPERLSDLPGRVYIGDETCERRLPNEDMLAWLRRHWSGADRRVTLAVPPLTDAGLRRLEELIPHLMAVQPAGFEVSINDLGALQRLCPRRAEGLSLACGRLLAGRYMAFPELPEDFLDFLAGRGVIGVELNSRSQLRSTRDQLRARGLRSIIHQPFVFVAMSRYCSCSGAFSGRGRDAIASCDLGCRRVRGSYRVGETEVFVAGNALWAKDDDPAPPSGADRVVANEPA